MVNIRIRPAPRQWPAATADLKPHHFVQPADSDDGRGDCCREHLPPKKKPESAKNRPTPPETTEPHLEHCAQAIGDAAQPVEIVAVNPAFVLPAAGAV